MFSDVPFPRPPSYSPPLCSGVCALLFLSRPLWPRPRPPPPPPPERACIEHVSLKHATRVCPPSPAPCPVPLQPLPLSPSWNAFAAALVMRSALIRGRPTRRRGSTTLFPPIARVFVATLVRAVPPSPPASACSFLRPCCVYYCGGCVCPCALRGVAHPFSDVRFAQNFADVAVLGHVTCVRPSVCVCCTFVLVNMPLCVRLGVHWRIKFWSWAISIVVPCDMCV